jgi:hypothetical protein
MNQQLDFDRVEKKPPLAWVYLNRPKKKISMMEAAIAFSEKRKPKFYKK